MKIKYFDNIPALPKKDMILTRLGYRKNVTAIDENQRLFLESGIKQGLILCHPQGAFGRFRITDRSDEHVTLEDNYTFRSMSLSKLLADSHEAVLMASTVGREITDRISSEVKMGNAALGVILDSTASQTADSVLDWMMDFINKTLRPECKKLTKHRYSPGYGDLPLQNQAIIFEAISMDKLGVILTPTYIMDPEKSVLAIAGIERIES